MSKRYWLTMGLCLLVCLMTVPASATTVSIQIVQMDDANVDATESSMLLEEGVMDSMFAHGYIVSNSPIVSDKKLAANSLALSMEDAISGSSDYLAHITVYFDRKSSTAAEANLLSNIKAVEWSLIQVRNNKELGAGTQEPGALVKKDNSARGIKTFGQQLAEAIYTAIKKQR